MSQSGPAEWRFGGGPAVWAAGSCGRVVGTVGREPYNAGHSDMRPRGGRPSGSWRRNTTQASRPATITIATTFTATGLVRSWTPWPAPGRDPPASRACTVQRWGSADARHHQEHDPDAGPGGGRARRSASPRKVSAAKTTRSARTARTSRRTRPRARLEEHRGVVEAEDSAASVATLSVPPMATSLAAKGTRRWTRASSRMKAGPVPSFGGKCGHREQDRDERPELRQVLEELVDGIPATGSG